MRNAYTLAVVENDFIWVLDPDVETNLNTAMSLMAKMQKLFPNVQYVVVSVENGYGVI